MKNTRSSTIKYHCVVCKKPYASQRALSVHLAKLDYCMEYKGNNNFHQNSKHQSIQPSLDLNIPFNKNESANTNLSSNELDDSLNHDTSALATTDNIINTELDDMETDTCYTKTGTICNKQALTCYQKNLLHEIKLLKNLNKLGAPLYAYSSIMKWAYEANVEEFNFNTQSKTYHQVVDKLEKMLNMKAVQPNTLTVPLIDSTLKMDVVVFDVPTLLATLFNDSKLNQYKNLVVNKQDRFSKYIPEDNWIGEVNSGQWYNTAYNNLIKDKDVDFLCPLILASNKTTLSNMGDLHVDAIFMSTSIFNCQVST